MSSLKTKEIEFYQKLGALFYAIAASDKVVHVKEYNALKNLVKKKWIVSDDYYSNEFQTDATYQMEIVFEWLDYENMEVEDCFDSFKIFYEENKSLFTIKRKDLIWETANAIAYAFSGKNKSELIILGKLWLLFKEK